MSKFALVIGKAETPIADRFRLVIGRADIEMLTYDREAAGDFRLPPPVLTAQAINEDFCRAGVTLRPVEIRALAGDLKQAAGSVVLEPVEVAARAEWKKPERLAVGHVFLREPELSARVVDPVDGAAGVALYPVEIGGRAEFGVEAGAEVALFPVEIGARSFGEKASRTAEGRVCLRPPEINSVIIDPVDAAGAVTLWPIEIGARSQDAETRQDAAGDIRLYRLEIGAQTRYEAPASGCIVQHCAMTGRALIRRFRELSQDEVEPYLWEDCFVLNMLNEAEREAADRAKLLYDDSLAVAVDVKAGTARYAIDPHVIDIERAALTAEGDRRPPLNLKLFDRMELDWRTPPRSRHEAGLPWGRPFGLVYDGKQEVEIVPWPRRNGRLLLGVHRLPWAAFDMDEEPEIPCIHHPALVDWALFRAFSIPDADEANEQLAAFYHDRFEKYFGRRIDARKRRLQRANKPHINKLW